jgi:dUTPase
MTFTTTSCGPCAAVLATPSLSLKTDKDYHMAIVAMQTDRVHPDAIFPTDNMAGTACFQFAALVENPEGEFIGPGGKMLVRTGITLMIPNSWIIEVYPRAAQDLTKMNSLGTRVALLDTTYRDEILIEVVNEGKSIVQVKHGDIIADGILTQVHGARFIDMTKATAEHAPEVPGLPNPPNPV